MLAAEPYPGRRRDDLELARRTATSSRSRATARPTPTRTRSSGCTTIGLPFDELYCSYDKIARCVELEIDVLIDDSPINLERALEVGITAATLEHPWNRELDGVISAPDWPTLATRLATRAGVKELPAPPDNRAYLPAIEPERQITDWGRSERVESLFDKTLYEFLYHYWFRVEVEGIENVPATGAALLVSNHAGALPPDAPMIAKAIKTEHARPRPLHLTVENFFKGYPGLSMLVNKLGGVPAHPANVHRLLHDEEQLVLVFPEGRKGTEKLYKDRYRLRRFGRGGFVESAMRAQGPDRPRRRRRRRGGDAGLRPHRPRPQAHRPHLLPGHADVPAARRLRRPRATCPRSSRSASWSPSRPTSGARTRTRTRASCRPWPRRSAAGSRRSCTRWSPSAESVWLRMRVLITGLSSYWGGRLAQVLEQDDAVEAIIGVSTEDPTCELHRTEYVRVGTHHALLRRIVHAAEIDTVIDTRLVVDSATAPPRVAHEQNVIGTMNILTACGGPNSPVTKVVFKSSAHYYGCERDDPSFFTETMRRPHEPRTRLESDIVEADDAVQGFAERNPRRHRHHAALLQRPRAGSEDHATARC